MDGLEMDHDGTYLVSDWVKGTVFRVAKDGSASPIVGGFKGAADIAYVASMQTLVVPRMGESAITAYKLPKS